MGIAGIVAASFVTGLSGAMMPGSLFVVVVANAIRGVAPGMAPVAGHAVAEFAMVSALAFGFGGVLSRPPAPVIIAVSGALMLAWMAHSLLRASFRAENASALAGFSSPATPWRLALQGIAATVSNPYWLLWWVTVGAGSVALWQDWGRAGIGAVYAGHIAADTLWYLIVSSAVSRGRSLITGRVHRILLGACGALLLSLSVYFASRALHMLA